MRSVLRRAAEEQREAEQQKLDLAMAFWQEHLEQRVLDVWRAHGPKLMAKAVAAGNRACRKRGFRQDGRRLARGPLGSAAGCGTVTHWGVLQ